MQKIDGLDYKIVNIVAAVSLPKELDRERIYEDYLRNQEKYEGKMCRRKTLSNVLEFNYKCDNAEFRIWKKKIVCLGTNSVQKAENEVLRLLNLLKERGFISLSSPEIKILNIVAAGKLPAKVDLEKLNVLKNSRYATFYEPSLFAGLTCIDREKKVTFNIFYNSHFVCLGAKDEHTLNDAILNLHSKLLENELYCF